MFFSCSAKQSAVLPLATCSCFSFMSAMTTGRACRRLSRSKASAIPAITANRLLVSCSRMKISRDRAGLPYGRPALYFDSKFDGDSGYYLPRANVRARK